MKYMTFAFFFSLFISSAVFASFDQAPPAFAYKDGKAVFVDFTDASHQITYDFQLQKVTVYSEIKFRNLTSGYPMFDLVPEPTETTLNGEAIDVELISDPHNASSYRVVKNKTSPGKHVLRMKHTIETNVVFNEKGVASAFWLSDLTDRKYLEQYLPSNLEFDQHSRRISVEILGAERIPHVLKANGKVTKKSKNKFAVEFPAFYSSSSVFFHLYPASTISQSAQFSYRSIDGRDIPVDIYTIVDITKFVDLTKALLAELESDYGPFPHNQLIIYGNSLAKGGMEYSGATMTGLLSLGHELFHSYNARGIIPANGNAGWMDEAMARWRDNGYPMTSSLSFDYTRIGGHSDWSRFTDRMSYTEGSAVLSLIAFKMNEKGMSLKRLLADYFNKYMYSTVTTPLFQNELSHASGMDFSYEFDRYIYGKFAQSKGRNIKAASNAKDPHHPHYTKKELHKFTMP